MDSSIKSRGEKIEEVQAFNKVNPVRLTELVSTPQSGTIAMAMAPGRENQLSARLSFQSESGQ